MLYRCQVPRRDWQIRQIHIGWTESVEINNVWGQGEIRDAQCWYCGQRTRAVQLHDICVVGKVEILAERWVVEREHHGGLEGVVEDKYDDGGNIGGDVHPSLELAACDNAGVCALMLLGEQIEPLHLALDERHGDDADCWNMCVR